MFLLSFIVLPSQKVRLLVSQAASQACMNARHRRLYGDPIYKVWRCAALARSGCLPRYSVRKIIVLSQK